MSSPNAYCITLASFLVPAVNQTVNVAAVADWCAGGQCIFIEGAGYYRIAGVHVGAPSIDVTNIGNAGNATVGTTINAGARVSPAGESSTPGPTGAPGPTGPSNGPFTVVSTTTSVTAASNTVIDVGATSAAPTITLPASPASGDWVQVFAGPNASIWPVTIGRNGHNIDFSAADQTLDVDFMDRQYVYSTANGWLVRH